MQFKTSHANEFNFESKRKELLKLFKGSNGLLK